jgi:MFS family permease
MTGGSGPTQPPLPGGSTDRRTDASTTPASASPSIRRTAVPTAFPALRHRNFRLFFGGFVVSLVGIWLQRVALAWLVLELTDSAFWVGSIQALGSLPVLLFSLYAGVLADRFPKERLVFVTQACSMVLALVLAAIVFAGIVELWHVAVIAFLLGTAAAFDIPARQSFLVELVGKDDLTNAIALNSSAFNASRVVGPAIGGVLIATVGVGACFLLNGLSYIAVLAALFMMRLPPIRRSAEPTRAWSSIKQGLRFVVTDVRIRTILLNVAVVGMFGFPVIVLLPIVARDVLGLGAQAYGWMMSAFGVGAVAGALGLAVFSRRIPKGRVLGPAAASFGALVVLVALTRSLPLVLILLTLVGLAMVLTTALTNTLLQTLAPDSLRGRVVSVYTMAFIGFTPFGAFQAGLIAEAFGAPTALAIGGLVTVAVAVTTVVRSREIREVV